MTDKQNKIISAAAEVFSKYGYKKTTIDEIVATAGISKGLFYHYYMDKKDAYLQIYDEYIGILHEAIQNGVDVSETDFFARLKQIAHIRISFFQKYPNLWGFLYSAYYEQHKDIAEEIKAKNELLVQNSFSQTAAGIDWSKMKSGISPDRAITLVTWIAEGYVRKMDGEKLKFDEQMYEDFDQYLLLLKDGLYQ